jgi:hypothetical protein
MAKTFQVAIIKAVAKIIELKLLNHKIASK